MAEDWEAQYMRYTGRLESPTVFHRWVALSTVGLALGRRIWISREGARGVFPGQIMVVLVAASGMCRKTTAVEQGKQLLLALNDRLPGSVNILPDRASPQKLIYRLQPRDETGEVIEGANCVAAIIAGEMGAYFSQEGYLETLATHVTALNDAPHGAWNREKRCFEDRYFKLDFMEAGETKLLNPCIGMLTATTPHGLATELPETARAGGFLGRSLLIYTERSDRPPNPMTSPDPPEGHDCWESLIEGLVWMAKNLNGLVRLTPEADEEYAKWYARYHSSNQHKDIRTVATAAALTGYVSRKTDHVLRVAMILAAMTQLSQGGKKPKLWIYPNHIKYAVQLLDGIEQHFDKAMELFDRAGHLGLQGKILRLLTFRHRDIPRAKAEIIKRMSRHGARVAQVDDALNQLVACEQVERTIGTRMARTGKEVTDSFYRALPTVQLWRFLEESSDAVLGEEPPEDDPDDELRDTNNLGRKRWTNGYTNGHRHTKWPKESSDWYQPMHPWDEDIDDN